MLASSGMIDALTLADVAAEPGTLWYDVPLRDGARRETAHCCAIDRWSPRMWML